MAKKIDRVIAELPKNFNQAKKEFQKCKQLFFIGNKSTKSYQDENEKVITEEFLTLEKKALLWLLFQEFESFLNKHESDIILDLKESMDKENTKYVLLAEYGKKVIFDEDANWFFAEEMNYDDWQEYDKKCNEKFLKERKKK